MGEHLTLEDWVSDLIQEPHVLKEEGLRAKTWRLPPGTNEQRTSSRVHCCVRTTAVDSALL